MAHFNIRPGTRSVTHGLKKPISGIAEFETVIQSLIVRNPLGCTSYMTSKKNNQPMQKVREMYTAKFVYENANGRRIGAGQEMYNSVEGYEYGIAAVISNMANVAAHKGKVRHISASDLFSVLLKCHDENGELYFLSIARDRVTVASYTDDRIKNRVAAWIDTVPALT